MSSSANTWAVIVAAGRSERFRAHGPKQFVTVAGRPLLLWPLDAFRDHEEIAGVTVVLPAETLRQLPEWLRRLQAEGVVLTEGGATRTDSVRAGLATVPGNITCVAVHDAARPLISAAAISHVLGAVTPERGAVAARRVTDSLKEVGEDLLVVRSVSRERLWRAETPQAFPRETIVEVHRRAEREGLHESDCAALCERYGVQVTLVEIAEPNLKVTCSEDLELAEVLLRRRENLAVEPGES
jgi:2-C-methyl-D-erythritol 4-phosphate cytidylyltransferase